jgi:hypothetical protein
MCAPRQFQAVIAADKVGVDQVFRRPAITGLSGRFGRALHDQIGRFRQAGQIGQRADIAMRESHFRLPQPPQIELRSAAMQVVECGYLRLWVASLEREGDTRSYEAGPPCNEDALMDRHYSVDQSNPKEQM